MKICKNKKQNQILKSQTPRAKWNQENPTKKKGKAEEKKNPKIRVLVNVATKM